MDSKTSEKGFFRNINSVSRRSVRTHIESESYCGYPFKVGNWAIRSITSKHVISTHILESPLVTLTFEQCFFKGFGESAEKNPKSQKCWKSAEKSSKILKKQPKIHGFRRFALILAESAEKVLKNCAASRRKVLKKTYFSAIFCFKKTLVLTWTVVGNFHLWYNRAGKLLEYSRSSLRLNSTTNRFVSTIFLKDYLGQVNRGDYFTGYRCSNYHGQLIDNIIIIALRSSSELALKWFFIILSTIFSRQQSVIDLTGTVTANDAEDEIYVHPAGLLVNTELGIK